jgi:hypothetical protein
MSKYEEWHELSRGPAVVRRPPVGKHYFRRQTAEVISEWKKLRIKHAAPRVASCGLLLSTALSVRNQISTCFLTLAAT